MRSIFKQLLYCIFGEWNGIQNLIAFPVLVFVFEQTSFGKWAVGLFSLHRYNLPVFLYLIFLLFMLFVIIKALSQWLVTPTSKTSLPQTHVGKDLLLPLILRLHYGILLLFFSLMIVFMLKSGYSFVFRRDLPFFSAFLFVVRYSMIFCLVYVYAFLDVVTPKLKSGHTFTISSRYFYLTAAKHWKRFFLILIVQIILILVTITVFEKIVGFIENLNGWGIISMTDNPIQFRFLEGKSSLETAINTLVIALGFLISNLLYSPFMLLFKKGFKILKLNLNG